MPITAFQKQVLLLLAEHRNPDSYVAGATVINRSDASARFSSDLDIFHDPSVSVLESYLADKKILALNKYEIEELIHTTGFVRCLVSRLDNSVKLDWVNDSALRFYPTIKDPDFGYRLHDIDAAINKCLALASRTEARDVVDLLTIHDSVLHIGYCCWGACGKDPGFTPSLILDQLSRNARITADLLSIENFSPGFDLQAIKKRWIIALAEAKLLIEDLDPAKLGCVFVEQNGEVVRIPTKTATVHFGSIKGAWPRVQK